jgi:hypothetical protein
MRSNLPPKHAATRSASSLVQGTSDDYTRETEIGIEEETHALTRLPRRGAVQEELGLAHQRGTGNPGSGGEEEGAPKTESSFRRRRQGWWEGTGGGGKAGGDCGGGGGAGGVSCFFPFSFPVM